MTKIEHNSVLTSRPSKKILCFLFVFMGIALIGNGQKPTEVIQKINMAYQDLEFISMDMIYTIFDSHTEASLEQKEGLVITQDTLKYYSIGQVETFSTPSFFIQIDNKAKTMGLYPVLRLKTQGVEPMDYNFEALLQLCDTVYLVSTDSSHACILKPRNQPFNELRIYYDDTNYFVTQIEVYYKAEIDQPGGAKIKPRIEIKYTNIMTQLQPDLKKMDVANYLIQENNRYQPGVNYADYKFVNELKH